MKHPSRPLKGLSVVIELHRWRGVACRSDLFLAYAVLGFVTVGASRFVLSDLMERLRASLRAFKEQDQ